jgi:hypothetical protein
MSNLGFADLSDRAISNKIFTSRRPSQPKKAQIAVDGAGRRYRDLRMKIR